MSASKFSLKGKVAVVTGGASGIGNAIVKVRLFALLFSFGLPRRNS